MSGENQAFGVADLETVEVPDVMFPETGAGDDDDAKPGEKLGQLDGQGDDDEDADLEADDGDDGDEDKEPSTRNRRRKRAQKKIRDKLDAAERRIAAMEAENRRLKKEREDLLKKAEDAEKDGADRQMKALEERKKQAIEDADLEELDAVNSEIMELKISERLRGTGKRVEAAPDNDGGSGSPDEPVNEIHPAARRWIEQNEWFGSNPRSQTAISLQNQLLAEGYAMGDELYEELDSRLARLDKRPATPRSPRAADEDVNVERDYAGDPKFRDGKRVITKAEKQNMARFGLDPGNPEHVRSYLKRAG